MFFQKTQRGLLTFCFQTYFTFNQQRKHCQLRLMFHHGLSLLCKYSYTHRVCNSPVVREGSCSQTPWNIPMPPFFLAVLPPRTYAGHPRSPSPLDPSTNTKICMVYSPSHLSRSCTRSSSKAGLLPPSLDWLPA